MGCIIRPILFSTVVFIAIVMPMLSAGAFEQNYVEKQYSKHYGWESRHDRRLPSYGMRDAYGNVLFTNSFVDFRSGSDAVYSVLSAGVVDAAGNASGSNGNTSSNAIGNSFNVSVTGAYNTAIVNSNQINNGDQSVNTELNGDLRLE